MQGMEGGSHGSYGGGDGSRGEEGERVRWWSCSGGELWEVELLMRWL